MKDLSQQRFGSLVAIKYVGNRKWLCQCDCGNTKEIHEYSLTSLKTTTCGKCNKKEVKVHDHFGDWEVIDILDKVYVLCRCSCGKERKVNKYSLLNKTSTGCGHAKNKDRLEDLKDREFGKLKVISYAGDSKWNCICKCGNTCVAKASKLKLGITTQCKKCRNTTFEDLSDQKFGMLKPIKYVGNKQWLCQCDCKRLKIISSVNLKNKSTKSCGCMLNRFSEDELLSAISQFSTENNRLPFRDELASYLNITYKELEYFITKYSLQNQFNTKAGSLIEQQVLDYINTLTNDVETHNRKILNGNELDIYIPSKKLALEINGDYWHSSLFKESTYHQKKTLTCAKQGIRLIHIFEHEWKNSDKQQILKDLIKQAIKNNNKRVYGRNTQINELDSNSSEVKAFLNKYHLQGWIYSSIALGCYYNNELIGLMTFGKPRFDSNHEYEIYRLCWKSGYAVNGGTNKLFSYFLEKYKPSSVVTYSDITKFTGNVYLRLGFQVDCITKPGYIWVNSKDSSYFNRYEVKTRLKEMKINTLNKTDDDIMYDMEYYKVYNSGNLKLEWMQK